MPGDGGLSLDDNLIIHGDNLRALKALLPRCGITQLLAQIKWPFAAAV